MNKALQSDVVSFFVPDQWKQVNIPILSDSPMEIDDPLSKALRIDFVRCNLQPLNTPLPVALFFPPENIAELNPETISIATTALVEKNSGLFMIGTPLLVNGVDRLFLDTVRDMIQIIVIVDKDSERGLLPWSIQFVNPRQLEDKYVATLMSDVSDEDIRLLQPSLREEYLRNRFRSYMNRFQFFHPDESKFDLTILLKENLVYVTQSHLLSSAQEEPEVSPSLEHPYGSDVR